MKKNTALKILIPIFLANILLFLVSFYFLTVNKSPVNSVDIVQTAIQISSILLLVLNTSILLTFLIYRKMAKKPHLLIVFLMIAGIFVAETFLLLRNMKQFDTVQFQSGLGWSSLVTSLLLFVAFNASLAFVIKRYGKRKPERKKL